MTSPALPPGVTWMIDDSNRSTAPHHLVLAQLDAGRGQVLWIDSRDVASTYALYAMAPTSDTLTSIQIARAWTAYQHYTLVRQLVKRATHRTRLIVLPHVCSLYRDDDLAEKEADQLLRATLRIISALSDTLDVAILVTAPQTEHDAIDPCADHELQCEATEYGYTFTGDVFQTTVYHGTDWWQTTIPYWVELLGAVRRETDLPLACGSRYTELEMFV